jgi:hypothetical protein
MESLSAKDLPLSTKSAKNGGFKSKVFAQYRNFTTLLTEEIILKNLKANLAEHSLWWKKGRLSSCDL